MGTFFELGKDKAAKGEGWAPPFISCAQDTSGALTPTAPTAIRLWDTFTFTFYGILAFTIFCHVVTMKYCLFGFPY